MLSLRRRLWSSTALALAGVWLLVMLMVHLSASEQIDQIHDAHMSKVARLALGLVGRKLEAHAEPAELREIRDFVHVYEQTLYLSLWDRDGHVLAQSGPEAGVRPGDDQAGFSTYARDGESYRRFYLVDPASGYGVQVLESMDQREQLSIQINSELFVGLLLSVPLLWGGIWWGLRRGLSPLQAITTEVAARDAGDFSPVHPQGDVPGELLPLTQSINKLLSRLHRALAQERRFTADAAHELRTPLAGLRLQVEVARKSSDPKVRDHALAQIVTATDRTVHMVNQLLALARFDSGEATPRTETVKPMRLLQQVIDELSAADGSIVEQVRIEGDESLQVETCRVSLEILLRNLLGNALRYGMSERGVLVSLASDNEGWSVTVQDWGRGIPEDLRSDMLSRFKRGKDAEPSGVGLGLSIVDRVVQMQQGDLSLAWTEPGCGLTARVSFPRHCRYG